MDRRDLLKLFGMAMGWSCTGMSMPQEFPDYDDDDFDFDDDDEESSVSSSETSSTSSSSVSSNASDHYDYPTY